MKKILLVIFVLASGCRSWSSDCNYIVPPGYKLRESNEGKFAIQITGTNDILTYYMRYSEFGTSEAGSGGDNFVNKRWFNDSCIAKGFLKYKLELDEKKKFK